MNLSDFFMKFHHFFTTFDQMEASKHHPKTLPAGKARYILTAYRTRAQNKEQIECCAERHRRQRRRAR